MTVVVKYLKLEMLMADECQMFIFNEGFVSFVSGQGKDLEEFFESTAGIILGENEDKTVEILFFKRLFCIAELALHHVTLGINSILHL